MTEKKKILGPIEIISLLAAIMLIAYITFKAGGGKLTERTETVQITDNPQFEDNHTQIRKYHDPKQEESVEEILRKISDQFGKDKVVRSDETILENSDVSEDEMKFLKNVKRDKQTQARDDTIDWFAVINSSRKTYSKVKSVFESAGVDLSNAEIGIASALVNEAAERTVYSKMESVFGIPEEKAKNFAKKGQNAVSDWARFVNNNTKK